MLNINSAAHLFNKHAQAYQDKFMDVSLYQNSLDEFLSFVPTNAHLLELACGPGNITKYLLQKRSDLNILATDLAPNMLTLAKTNNPIVQFELMDMKDLLNLSQQFEAVMCAFGFPYLTKQEAIQWIADTSKVLKPKGILYISTMEDDNYKSGFKKGSQGDEIFMNYHEASYLTEVIQQSNFKLLKLDRVITQTDTETVIDLILIAQNL